MLRHALPPVVPTMPQLLVERRHTSVRSMLTSLALERAHLLPVVLHADDDPATLLRLVIERLGEGADPGVGQPLGRAVAILACRIVVQHEQREPYAGTRLRILQHLPIAARVAERRIRPAPDHEVDALGLAGIVVVQQELGLLSQEWLAVLAVAVLRST